MLTDRGDVWQILAVGLLIVVFMISVAVATLGILELAQHTNGSIDACHQVNNLRVVIVGSLHRSLRTIPTIAYYKTHPHDLRLALEQIYQELRLFHPVSC